MLESYSQSQKGQPQVINLAVGTLFLSPLFSYLNAFQESFSKISSNKKNQGISSPKTVISLTEFELESTIEKELEFEFLAISWFYLPHPLAGHSLGES